MRSKPVAAILALVVSIFIFFVIPVQTVNVCNDQYIYDELVANEGVPVCACPNKAECGPAKNTQYIVLGYWLIQDAVRDKPSSPTSELYTREVYESSLALNFIASFIAGGLAYTLLAKRKQS